MEFSEVVGRRAMVRSFTPDPVPDDVIGGILLGALRAPSAGNSGGTAWLALRGPAETGVYWDATTDSAWREANPSRWEGLRRAPVILLAYASAEAYLQRYGEPDKAGSGLAVGAEAWTVPYWTGDAAFGVMTVLLAAVDAGLGACFLGNFRGEEPLARALGVPGEWRLFGAVLLGRADGGDHRSASLDRPRRDAASRLHFGRWGSMDAAGVDCAAVEVVDDDLGAPGQRS
jgi:nitroreductase